MENNSIPRFGKDDYTREAAENRRKFLLEATGAELTNVGQYSTEPEAVSGNCENLIGMLQIPVGIAGPVRINGEHAQGDFYIPLATTEGTLVASYSRGMKAISECGGITTTVFDDCMQRAPAFVFDSARDVKAFCDWIDESIEDIKAQAESTTSVGKLLNIQRWPMNRTVYTRWNYSTGDAAGQNMVSKASDFACKWILQNYPGKINEYFFSSNVETDKKYSHLNFIHSRGKRVIAEVTLARDVVKNLLHTTPEALQRIRDVSSGGSFLAGSGYDGGHSANGIASFFLATGQDEANVVESHCGNVTTQVLDNGDLYWAWTLPSLIVATYGGGTGLPSQKECLRILGCEGAGKARKLAEIAAAVVAAGDISILSAIVSGEFVDSHEKYGRNR